MHAGGSRESLASPWDSTVAFGAGAAGFGAGDAAGSLRRRDTAAGMHPEHLGSDLGSAQARPAQGGRAALSVVAVVARLRAAHFIGFALSMSIALDCAFDCALAP